MMLMVVMIVGAIGNLSQQQMNSVARTNWQKMATYAAYAGVQKALSELEGSHGWSAGIADTPMPGQPNVLYQVEVTNNYASGSGVMAPDGKTWVPPGAVFLYSLGKVEGRESEGVGGYAVLVGAQRPAFDHAIFGQAGVTLTNSSVLMYDPEGVVTASDPIAHVGTNSTDLSALVSTASTVEGKLLSPVGSPAGVVSVSGGTNAGVEIAEETKLVTEFPITGTPAPLVAAQQAVASPGTMAPPWGGLPLSDTYWLAPGSYGDVVVPPGRKLGFAPSAAGDRNYKFRNLVLMPGASIEVNTIPDYSIVCYVENNVILLGNNLVNWDTATDQPRMPRELQFYLTGLQATPTSNTTLSVTDCPKTSFIACAQKGQATLTNSTVYGSLIMDRCTLANSTLYYDVRVTGVLMDGAGQFALLNIIELKPGEASAAIALSSTVATTAAAAPPAAATGPPPPLPPPPPPPPPPSMAGPAAGVVAAEVAAAAAAAAAAPAAPAAPASAPAAAPAPAPVFTSTAVPAPAVPGSTGAPPTVLWAAANPSMVPPASMFPVPAAPAPAPAPATAPAAPAPATAPAAPAPAAPAAAPAMTTITVSNHTYMCSYNVTYVSVPASSAGP